MTVEIVREFKEESEEAIVVRITPPLGYEWSTVFTGKWITAVAIKADKKEER